MIIPTSDLNISRNILPQIQSKDIPEFLSWLKKEHGVTHKKERVPLKKVKASQGEFNPAKIKKLMSKPSFSSSKPALMSRDDYIVDGHHRYASDLNRNPNGFFAVFRVNMNVHELIQAAHRFEKSFTKEIHEDKSIVHRILKVRKT